MIDFYQDAIAISDEHGEIVSWHESEWKERPDQVYAIVNTICVFYEEGPEALRKKVRGEEQ